MYARLRSTSYPSHRSEISDFAISKTTGYGRTDVWTDRPSYRDARTHLKNEMRKNGIISAKVGVSNHSALRSRIKRSFVKSEVVAPLMVSPTGIEDKMKVMRRINVGMHPSKPRWKNAETEKK